SLSILRSRTTISPFSPYTTLFRSSVEFRTALRELRLKFNLIQRQIAELAGILQTDYSDFETGKKKLDLDSADNISTKVWGVSYRSEEHTSELQSRENLVCSLQLEK